jgi:hypothetical protein
MVVMCVVISWGLITAWGGREPPSVRPQLEAHPQQDLRTYQAAQRAKLTGYAWIDRSHGVVQIPIDEAMKQLANQPAKTTGEAPNPASEAPTPASETPTPANDR